MTPPSVIYSAAVHACASHADDDMRNGSDIATLQKLIDAKSAEVNVADAEEGDTPLGVACRRVVAPCSSGM